MVTNGISVHFYGHKVNPKTKERPEKPADLTPDDVRRIREKLGLSQVEAGEILGGGPRAFTKYEGGAIKPAAAIANLLRMLEANPATLGTLTGKKLPPIETDGSRPFEVTGQHVAALSERKLVNLTRRLLAAEAQSGELPMDGIHVAAVITAPDGGEDAKIEWSGGPDRTKWLPVRATTDCDHALRLTATTRYDRLRPPVPGDRDQPVDGCDGRRWVIRESAWASLLFHRERGRCLNRDYPCARSVTCSGCPQPVCPNARSPPASG